MTLEQGGGSIPLESRQDNIVPSGPEKSKDGEARKSVERPEQTQAELAAEVLEKIGNVKRLPAEVDAAAGRVGKASADLPTELQERFADEAAAAGQELKGLVGGEAAALLQKQQGLRAEGGSQAFEAVQQALTELRQELAESLPPAPFDLVPERGGKVEAEPAVGSEKEVATSAPLQEIYSQRDVELSELKPKTDPIEQLWDLRREKERAAVARADVEKQRAFATFNETVQASGGDDKKREKAEKKREKAVVAADKLRDKELAQFVTEFQRDAKLVKQDGKQGEAAKADLAARHAEYWTRNEPAFREEIGDRADRAAADLQTQERSAEARVERQREGILTDQAAADGADWSQVVEAYQEAGGDFSDHEQAGQTLAEAMKELDPAVAAVIATGGEVVNAEIEKAVKPLEQEQKEAKELYGASGVLKVERDDNGKLQDVNWESAAGAGQAVMTLEKITRFFTQAYGKEEGEKVAAGMKREGESGLGLQRAQEVIDYLMIGAKLEEPGLRAMVMSKGEDVIRGMNVRWGLDLKPPQASMRIAHETLRQMGAENAA